MKILESAGYSVSPNYPGRNSEIVNINRFGVLLSHQIPFKKEKNWYKNSGIGPRVNVGAIRDDNDNIIEEFEQSFGNISNFVTFGEKYHFYQDEIKFEMMAAFRETDNQLLIHVPAKSLLLPGGIKLSVRYVRYITYFKLVCNFYIIRKCFLCLNK